jgi:hypothetical protein
VCNDRTGRSPKTKEDEVNISQTTSGIGAVLATVATIGAIVVLASSAQAATSRPAGMSQPAYRALTIRSEALNTLHGNAVTRLSPQRFTGLYQAGANRMAPQEFAALVARSAALNRQYRLERTSQPTTVVEQPTGSSNGFDWGDFGIGAAAMLGIVLLSGGLAGAYFGRKIGMRPRVT